MKKTLLAIFIVALTWSIVPASAQFVATPNGMRSVADTSKTYIVVQKDGSTPEENYKILKEYILNTYASAKNVLSEVEGKVLAIYGANDFVAKKNGNKGLSFSGQFSYRIVFTCKDDKVKIEPIVVEMTTGTGGFGVTFAYYKELMGSIFDANGGVRFLGFKNELEETINDVSSGAVRVLTKATDKDDW